MQEYGVLGTLVARPFESHLAPTKRREWRMLAVLVMYPGATVPLERMVESLWPDDPPKTANDQIWNCAGQLRRAVAAVGAGPRVVRFRDGLRLEVDPASVDHAVFGELTAQARQAMRGHDLAGSAALLRRALDCWRGPVLGGDVPQPLLAEAARLEEMRLTVTETHFSAALQLGSGRDVLPDLVRHVQDNPWREEGVSLLMTALHGAGRTADALAAYEDLRTRLRDGLGVDPGGRVRQTWLGILQGAPAERAAPSQAAAKAELASALDHLRWAVAQLTRASERLAGLVG